MELKIFMGDLDRLRKILNFVRDLVFLNHVQEAKIEIDDSVVYIDADSVTIEFREKVKISKYQRNEQARDS